MITSWDDFPVHQTAEPIRHVATSDRNFYDRYYFNCHNGGADDIFCVFGMGVYPNLGTHDAFFCVVTGGTHYVIRANQPLVDRQVTSVGPLSIEVLEPLERLRVLCEETAADGTPISCDLTFVALHPPHEEPKQYVRKHGRVVFDTSRFAQMGRWIGRITVGEQTFDVTPDAWVGSRDRSWGVRPVGEPEAPGIHTDPVMVGMWNYIPMIFDDHSILVMVQEEGDGTRTIDEATRVWHDPERPSEWLGRPEPEHTLKSGTRLTEGGSVVRLPDAPGGPLEITVDPVVRCYLAIGTGYGLGDEYRHGMWLGDEVTVEGKSWPQEELDGWAWYAIVENATKFAYTDATGTHEGIGMLEHMFISTYPKLGLTEPQGVAP